MFHEYALLKTKLMSPTFSKTNNVLYSVFLWIPPVAFHYREIKATAAKALKLKTFPLSVAFILSITKLGESKETHCIPSY